MCYLLFATHTVTSSWYTLIFLPCNCCKLRERVSFEIHLTNDKLSFLVPICTGCMPFCGAHSIYHSAIPHVSHFLFQLKSIFHCFAMPFTRFTNNKSLDIRTIERMPWWLKFQFRKYEKNLHRTQANSHMRAHTRIWIELKRNDQSIKIKSVWFIELLLPAQFIKYSFYNVIPVAYKA